MAAIDIDGGVPSTTLNGAITSGATSITVADGSSYPDGTNGNFYIVIDLGAAAEETIECSARSSNTFTVATRGADGTSAASHDNGATVQHVVPALTLQEANTHANQTTGTPHGSAYVTPSGNVATATALETGRTIVLSGDVSGTSGSFDGTANATITTTVADDSHNHTDSTITGTLSNDTTGNAATATALATARLIGGVSFDGTANINLPGVNATGNQDTTGNATTATALETARTIGGVSFDGTANINLPGVNTAGNQDTSGTAAVATTATLTDAGTDTTCFPVLAGAATGNEGLETDASALTYNASTGTLSATTFSGTATNANQLDSLDSTQFLRSDQSDTLVGQFSIDNDTDIVNSWSLYIDGNHGTSATVGYGSATVVISDAGDYPSLAWRSANLGYATVMRLSTAAANKLVLRNAADSGWGDLELGTLTQSSDLTLKTKTGEAPGLDLVNRLAPFAGHWNDQPGEVNFWLGAQEVAEALTGAGFDPAECGVVQDVEDTMGLQYTQLVPVLVKAVQELTARLEAVEGS
jgi:hypothetical protein